MKTMRVSGSLVLAAAFAIVPNVEAFVAPAGPHGMATSTQLYETATTASDELKIQKRKLLELIGEKAVTDPVLADPLTKEPIQIDSPGVLLAGERGRQRIKYRIRSPSNQYQGSSDTFINLLEPVKEQDGSTSSTTPLTNIMKQFLPYVPPPLRAPFGGLTDGEYLPMRDLFTSPAVSFAYERGWRQGFAQAGFPGADVEAAMAMDYFAPVVARTNSSVVVDMSCATGLFTRRFASEDKYDRVLGCDYSESMLTEARRRINTEPKLGKDALKKTTIDLVRLDVGQIPMRDETVDCLHAGAAMHCWPDLDAAASEIYRVLKPGGRYFATTFLNIYFSSLIIMDDSAGVVPSKQAFQYFESVETLRDLLERGGFEREKIMIEVLGTACVVIRAEK